MKLSNKIALITGAGSGFGRASATLFSQEGAKVSVVDVDEKTGDLDRVVCSAIQFLGAAPVLRKGDWISRPDNLKEARRPDLREG